MKYNSYSICPLLDATAALQGGNLTLSAFENFIRTNETSIDRFLKINAVQKGYIKKLMLITTNKMLFSEQLYDSYNDYNHDSMDHAHGVYKINNSYQSRLSLKCDICSSYAHTKKLCIFNEADNLRLANMKNNRTRNCLLLRSLSHVDT